MNKKIVAGALVNCVHVAGVAHFLSIADELGFETVFLGAAVPLDEFIAAIEDHDPAIVGVSYRLTPEVGEHLLNEFQSKILKKQLQNRRFVFGGTPPMVAAARQIELFERFFDGFEHLGATRAYLSGTADPVAGDRPTGDLIERISKSYPVPLLRHHFGLADLPATIDGVRTIAQANVLDIISLAPDQNAQESFFRPDQMDRRLDGAGGAPIRSREDLITLRQASQTGSQPLLRVYSGTRDLLNWAELSAETIDNAWGAVPLCWYSALDGRSDRPLETAIAENQQAMRWYAKHNRPLEVNESHHWSLRDAPDTIAVVMAYLAAYNAKAMGITHYIAQYMFNTPPNTSPQMDLAKMLAKIELIESLHDAHFTTFRQTRAGLLHLSPNLNQAKGQLAASTANSLQIKPHIIHVVGYCEGDHAATAKDVIESCEIVQGVLKNCLKGQPDETQDPRVQARKAELLGEAQLLLDAISKLGDGTSDPFSDPATLALAIHIGLIDAPHLKGNSQASGTIETRCIHGAIRTWDRTEKRILSEVERIERCLARA